MEHLWHLTLNLTYRFYGRQQINRQWRELQWSSRDIAQKLRLSQPRYFEMLRDNQLLPYHYWRICFPTIVLYVCSFSKGYGIKMDKRSVLRLNLCPTIIKFTAGHGMFLVGTKSGSESIVGLVSSVILSWAPLLRNKLTVRRYCNVAHYFERFLNYEVGLLIVELFDSSLHFTMTCSQNNVVQYLRLF
jgi:hypothetical protein